MNNIAILGTTGMLGSTLTRFLSSNDFIVTEFNRAGIPVVKGNSAHKLNIENIECDLNSTFQGKNFEYIINAVGMIRQKINIKSIDSINTAFTINASFPLLLNNFSKNSGIRIIQIGTDCVYSGKLGKYSEEDNFDPTDVYGKSKLAGEQNSTELMTIRTSIIGTELSSTKSLIGWVLSQENNAVIKGFVNHLWNGVSTLDFARIVSGIVKNNFYEPGISHLVPADRVNKFELVKAIASSFKRFDLEVVEFHEEISVDRTLTTVNSMRNARFWNMAGYNEIPTIAEMVSNYAKWSSQYSN
jgi:dTDP-4-dehydrorhamnose reductase